jgi:type IV secretory pathway VirB4 component
MKIDNIKEEVTHDMQNSEKKRNRSTKHSESPLQQTRTSRRQNLNLKIKWEIKGKTEEMLVKQLTTCKNYMQELTDSTKRPNLRIKGIEEGEEVQVKGICNIFNKIITKNFPNLKELCLFRYSKPPGYKTDLTKIELPHNILSLKQAQRMEKEY